MSIKQKKEKTCKHSLTNEKKGDIVPMDPPNKILEGETLIFEATNEYIGEIIFTNGGTEYQYLGENLYRVINT